MQPEYTIYALVHPITNEIRYIGYTSKSLKERLRYHYYDLSKKITSHKVNWLQSLKNEGLFALIIILEQDIKDLKTVLEREVFHISQHNNLVNSTSGGERNKVFCDEVKRKIGNSMRGKLVGNQNPMFGKKREDLRIRNINNNPAKNKDISAKIAATLSEKYNTPEYKLILRQSQKTCKPVNRMDFEGNILQTYKSIHEAIDQGFGSKEISKCCNGIYRQHKGFIWSFALIKTA